ncbi:ABA4-like family protein [Larkinella insperata]|uniref:ABA4-like family protein n=1 Tax=Larkinella insperata TaxID=332158 RepID=A0ABW3QEA7_9BACT|nr:ABA4-like family protein [Larkinella insperata]
MTPDTVFQIANALVLPQWLLMIVAPHWRPTEFLTKTLLIPAVLALFYIFYLFLGDSELDFQSFSTLAGIKTLFSKDAAVLAGWIHYLAFDLTVGSWMLRNAQRRQVAHAWVIPCLIFSFLLGPVGLLLYLIVRTVKRKKLY